MQIATLMFEAGAPLQVPQDFKVLSVRIVGADPVKVELVYASNIGITKWIATKIVDEETDLSALPLCDGSVRIPDSHYFMWWTA